MIAHVTQFEQEIAALEQKGIKVFSKRENVVFYGSSSIRLWSTLESDFSDYNIANLGFGGSSIIACTYFFERIVPLCNPTSIVFYAGDNDIGNGADSKDILRRFNSFLKICDRNHAGISVTFVSIKPSLEREQLVPIIQSANREVKKLIKTRPNTFYLDVHSTMLDDKGKVRKDIYIQDGLHLNEKGYDLWRAVFRNEIGRKVFF